MEDIKNLLTLAEILPGLKDGKSYEYVLEPGSRYHMGNFMGANALVSDQRLGPTSMTDSIMFAPVWNELGEENCPNSKADKNKNIAWLDSKEANDYLKKAAAEKHSLHLQTCLKNMQEDGYLDYLNNRHRYKFPESWMKWFTELWGTWPSDIPLPSNIRAIHELLPDYHEVAHVLVEWYSGDNPRCSLWFRIGNNRIVFCCFDDDKSRKNLFVERHPNLRCILVGMRPFWNASFCLSVDEQKDIFFNEMREFFKNKGEL